jgi:uncharacterized delta-60 repeat protein
VKVHVICALMALTSGGVLLGVGPASAAAAGSLDPTFGTGGQVLTGLGEQQPGDALPQANGDILVGVSGGGAFGVLRYLPDGTLDTGFGTGGALTTDFQGDDSVAALLVQPSGDIVAVGSSEDNSTGQVDIALARYAG